MKSSPYYCVYSDTQYQRHDPSFFDRVGVLEYYLKDLRHKFNIKYEFQDFDEAMFEFKKAIYEWSDDYHENAFKTKFKYQSSDDKSDPQSSILDFTIMDDSAEKSDIENNDDLLSTDTCLDYSILDYLDDIYFNRDPSKISIREGITDTDDDNNNAQHEEECKDDETCMSNISRIIRKPFDSLADSVNYKIKHSIYKSWRIIRLELILSIYEKSLLQDFNRLIHLDEIIALNLAEKIKLAEEIRHAYTRHIYRFSTAWGSLTPPIHIKEVICSFIDIHNQAKNIQIHNGKIQQLQDIIEDLKGGIEDELSSIKDRKTDKDIDYDWLETSLIRYSSFIRRMMRLEKVNSETKIIQKTPCSLRNIPDRLGHLRLGTPKISQLNDNGLPYYKSNEEEHYIYKKWIDERSSHFFNSIKGVDNVCDNEDDSKKFHKGLKLMISHVDMDFI